MKYIFVDVLPKFITAINSYDYDYKFLGSEHSVESCVCDISTLTVKNTGIISAANSFGSMGGGVDYVYDRIMFKNISRTIKDRIKVMSPYKTSDNPQFDKLRENLHYIPIGSALVTSLSDYIHNSYIITAPTMYVPMNVATTNNAYLAYFASLCVVEKSKINITSLYCTGLANGVGLMPAKESAAQIRNALYDFHVNKLRMKDISKFSDLCLI